MQSPASELIEEEIYDELADLSGQPALPPPSDPFYNVLEPEYLQPRHPSPVPIKTLDEPPDEGYGNSSGGSENDCHSSREESHYKTLPRQLRPVRPAGSAAPTAIPATSATENGETPAPPTPASSTSAPSTANADRPKRPTQLPSAPRPRAATAGAASAGGTSSVADVIRRLNRQSVGDEDLVASRPAPRQPAAPISAELARKQALIAAGVRDLSPVGKTGKSTTYGQTKPAVPIAKPTAIPPKPVVPAGKPKPKPAPPSRQEAKPEYGRTGGAGARPAAAPQPNKSAVYKALQRMSDTESRTGSLPGREAAGGRAVTTEPEEGET